MVTALLLLKDDSTGAHNTKLKMKCFIFKQQLLLSGLWSKRSKDEQARRDNLIDDT